MYPGTESGGTTFNNSNAMYIRCIVERGNSPTQAQSSSGKFERCRSELGGCVHDGTRVHGSRGLGSERHNDGAPEHVDPKWAGGPPYLFAVSDTRKFTGADRRADIEVAEFVAPDAATRTVFNISELSTVESKGDVIDYAIEFCTRTSSTSWKQFAVQWQQDRSPVSSFWCGRHEI